MFEQLLKPLFVLLSQQSYNVILLHALTSRLPFCMIIHGYAEKPTLFLLKRKFPDKKVGELSFYRHTIEPAKRWNIAAT